MRYSMGGQSRALSVLPCTVRVYWFVDKVVGALSPKHRSSWSPSVRAKRPGSRCDRQGAVRRSEWSLLS